MYSISILGVDFGSECRPGVRWMRSEVEIAGEFLLFFFFFFSKANFFYIAFGNHVCIKNFARLPIERWKVMTF